MYSLHMPLRTSLNLNHKASLPDVHVHVFGVVLSNCIAMHACLFLLSNLS